MKIFKYFFLSEIDVDLLFHTYLHSLKVSSLLIWIWWIIM